MKYTYEIFGAGFDTDANRKKFRVYNVSKIVQPLTQGATPEVFNTVVFWPEDETFTYEDIIKRAIDDNAWALSLS